MFKVIKCNELNEKLIDKKVEINAWVKKIRHHGKFIFLNIRDRYEKAQVLVNEEKLLKIAEKIKLEYCIKIQGLLIKRPPNMINANMKTGHFEILAKNIEIISKCNELPFMIEDDNNASENSKLEYRYLDLRRDSLKNKIILRCQATHLIRNF